MLLGRKRKLYDSIDRFAAEEAPPTPPSSLAIDSELTQATEERGVRNPEHFGSGATPPVHVLEHSLHVGPFHLIDRGRSAVRRQRNAEEHVRGHARAGAR